MAHCPAHILAQLELAQVEARVLELQESSILAAETLNIEAIVSCLPLPQQQTGSEAQLMHVLM